MGEIKLVSAEAFSPARKCIVILGSSTGFGFGASSYAMSWAGRLETALKAIDPAWQVINVSLSGTGTQQSLDRYMSDVAPLRPSFVIHCTSIINEPGIGSDELLAARTFLRNRKKLQALDEMIGAKTIQASHYPNNTTDAVRYQLMLASNAQIEAWGVPVIDWMSALDDGTGKFAVPGTYNIDTTHVNDAGHAIYFDAIDLSWFWQFTTNAQPPAGSGAWELTGSPSAKAFPVVLSSPAKSFSMWARIKSKSGFTTGSLLMAAMVYGPGNTPLRVRVPSSVAVLSDSISDVATSGYNPTSDFAAHELGMSYNAATNRIAFFLDGALVGSVATPNGSLLATDTFGFLSRPDMFANAAVGMAISRCALWRSPLSPVRFASIKGTGRLPLASLVYHGECNIPPGSLAVNYAPTDVLPNIGTANGWVHAPGF